jgi:hypothetical protein
VGIVLLVANTALQRGFTVLFAGNVAFHTLCFLMFTVQGKVGFAVIKILLVDRSHLCISPFVIGMASPTGRIRQSAVKSIFSAYVGTNVLVAAHAQTILGFAVKPDVALLAFFLDLGVSGNDFAWRHDGLNVLGPCNRAKTKKNRSNTQRQPRTLVHYFGAQ